LIDMGSQRAGVEREGFERAKIAGRDGIEMTEQDDGLGMLAAQEGIAIASPDRIVDERVEADGGVGGCESVFLQQVQDFPGHLHFALARADAANMHKPGGVAFDDGVPVDRFVRVHEESVFAFPWME
jgi:hypothetical protein